MSTFFLNRVKSGHSGQGLSFSVLDNIHVKDIAEMPVGSLMECKAFLKSLSIGEVKHKADYQLISATRYDEPRLRMMRQLEVYSKRYSRAY